MSWIVLSICSAIVPGVYELLMKLAINQNGPPPRWC